MKMQCPYEDLYIYLLHGVMKREDEGMLGKDRFRAIPRVIISGLMRSQARQVRQDLRKYEIPVIREREYEMTWYTILAGEGKIDGGRKQENSNRES
jgi:hypothetical protein